MTSDYVKPGQKQMHEALEAAGVRVVVAKEAVPTLRRYGSG